MSRFRIHGDLRDFLSRDRHDGAFEYDAPSHATLKDTVEALGIPHVEVDRAFVDGGPVTLSEYAAPTATVDVHPAVPGQPHTLLPPPQAQPSFILDGHLGRLAAYLRMLGFDVAWSAHADDAELAQRSAEEDRTLLTRDVGLLKRGIVRRGAFVRATNSEAQLREIVTRFDLRDRTRPFTRCLRCNTPLEGVTKEEVADRLPPHVRATQQEFRRCPTCGRIFWPGSHHSRMSRLLPG